MSFIRESADEIILLGLIILNVIDFLEIINPDLDYIKKIISLSALAYLLVRASITSLFTGTRKIWLDITIILTYVMLSIKDLLSYSVAAVSQMSSRGLEYWAQLYPVQGAQTYYNVTAYTGNSSLASASYIPMGSAGIEVARAITISLARVNEVYIRVVSGMAEQYFLVEPRFFVHRWHNFLIDNTATIERFALIAGLVILTVLAFYMALRIPIKSPSLLHLMEEWGPVPTSLKSLAVRFLLLFVALNFFYIAIFNLTVEWFAFAVDAPILMIGLMFYLLFWIKHHKRFRPESIVFKIGQFGEESYKRFIGLFHSKKGLVLGLAGILVLHLLTDIGNFLVPYAVGFHDPLYFQALGPGHAPLFSLEDAISHSTNSHYFADIALSDARLSLAYLYLMNLVGYTLLFLAPAVVWYSIFVGRRVKPGSWSLGLFYASVLVVFTAPALVVSKVRASHVVGVDITTQSLLAQNLDIAGIAIASILAFALAFALSWTRMRKLLVIGAFILGTVFFSLYIYFYFTDIFAYYVGAASQAMRSGEFAIGMYMVIFMSLTMAMYAGGFLAYLYECATS